MIFQPLKIELGRLWRWISTPPYSGIPWVVCLYVLISCLVYTDNGPFTGHVIGFDDQVRMTQVLNLVNGAGWYDRVIARANPPEGFETVWTRIVDIPIALVVLAGQIFTDQRTAALAATVIVPFAQLIVLFYVARYFARPMAGKKDAWLIILFIMFTSVLNQKRHTLAGFHIGEASHHSWYVILNVLMFGAAARVAMGVRGMAPAFLMALAIALLLAVGIEGFPMIAGTAVVLAVLAWIFNYPALALRSTKALTYGALLSLLLLPVHAPPDRWFDISFSQPSILGPILVASAAAFLGLETLLLRWTGHRKIVTLIAMMAMASLFVAFLIASFPQLLLGPAAALSPQERQLAFSDHPEAWPMWRTAATTSEFVGLAMPTVIALGAGIFAMWKTGNRRRRIMYAAYFGFAGVGGGMAEIFWRYVHHAMTSACVWLLWLWQRIRAWLPKNKSYALASFGAFVALGPFWMLLWPSMAFDVPFMSQVVFYPGKIYLVQNPWETCDALQFADYLNKHYDKNTLLSVPDWDSATFLYNTDLRIDFLSNFPSQNKFIDNRIFFDTQDPDEAKIIAARHDLDLVAICTVLPMGMDTIQSRPYRKPMLIETLKEGTPPRWLKPVTTGVPGYYRLFAVDKKLLKNSE